MEEKDQETCDHEWGSVLFRFTDDGTRYRDQGSECRTCGLVRWLGEKRTAVLYGYEEE